MSCIKDLFTEQKTKNGHIPNIPTVSSEEEEGVAEVTSDTVSRGEVSWPRHICMSGLTFCFKVE